MCADLAFVCFVIAKLLMDTASGAPTMKDQEIKLKLRLIVPEKSPIVSYPNINSPTSSLSNPLFSAYQSIQPPQPPVPPTPPLNFRQQRSTILNRQDLTYDATPLNRWGSIIRSVRSKVKSPLVIHQPEVNDHYTPSVYVSPTRLVPMQLFVHKPITTMPSTMRPIIVTGFNNGMNYGYNSRGTTTTQKSPDLAEMLKERKSGIDEKPEKDDKPEKTLDFAERLKELKSGIDKKPEKDDKPEKTLDFSERLKELKSGIDKKPEKDDKPEKTLDFAERLKELKSGIDKKREKDDKPEKTLDFAERLKELKSGIDKKPEKDDKPEKISNDTTKEFDLLNHPLFKDDMNPYIGKLDDEDERDDYDDTDDLPTGKVAAIRSMWGGYVPRSLLQDALRQSKSTPRSEAESQGSPSQKKRVRKGMNEALLKQFENGLNTLQETIKANENDKEIKNTIKELHDSDYDAGDNEENESHLPYFVDFWGNRVPKYQNELTEREQNLRESAGEKQDPHGWNPNYTKGLWSEDDSHLQVFSRYQNKPRHEEQEGEVRKEYDNGMGEGVAANYKKYVSDNGTWLADHYNPSGVGISHTFNQSVANERPLDNPNEKNDTYEKVVDFQNGKIPENDTVGATKPTQNASVVQNATVGLGVNSGEMTSVKDFLPVLAENKKERINATKAGEGKQEEPEEETLDSDKANGEYVLTEDTDIPADMLANIDKPPDGALCKSVVGVDRNDTNNEMHISHVRGFLCVKDYDEEEDF